MAIRIKGLTERDLRKLQANAATDMSIPNFQKLQKPHSDISQVKKLKSPEQRIYVLEREVKKLKKNIASIEMQSTKAYAKAFNLELKVATLIEKGEDINGGEGRKTDDDQGKG